MTTPDPLTSPAGDRRENSVPCRSCHRQTWAIDRRCSVCGQHPDIEPVRDDDDRRGEG